MKAVLIDNRGGRFESVGSTDTDTRATFENFRLTGRFVRIELWQGNQLIDARDAS